MKKPTYYEILGVKKNAKEAEIKTAFRKLARKFHPDMNDDPKADDKLAEINNAYEVLMDKEKRAKYDASLFNPFINLSNFAKNNFSKSHFANAGSKASSNTQGFNWEELKEKLGENSPFGSNSFRFDDVFSAFGYKNGKKQEKDTEQENKQEFFANLNQNEYNQYSNQQEKKQALNQHADINIDLDSVYTGDTYNIKLNVPVRLANGDISHQQKHLNFTVPKGITEGKQIRLTGQGAVSLSGDQHGDLLLTVHIETPKHIRVEGSDVYQTVDVLPWEAGLGADIQVGTPAGEFTVTIPKRCQDGNSLRLRGKGIPSKPAGDLYLLINIINPDMSDPLTTEQEQALQHLKSAFSKDG